MQFCAVAGGGAPCLMSPLERHLSPPGFAPTPSGTSHNSTWWPTHSLRECGAEKKSEREREKKTDRQRERGREKVKRQSPLL